MGRPIVTIQKVTGGWMDMGTGEILPNIQTEADARAEALKRQSSDGTCWIKTEVIDRDGRNHGDDCRQGAHWNACYPVQRPHYTNEACCNGCHMVKDRCCCRR